MRQRILLVEDDPAILRGLGDNLRTEASDLVDLNVGVPPVGMFPALATRNETLQLHGGDWLVIFSDGVSEALNVSGEEFGRDRILGLVRENHMATVESMRDLLDGAVRDYSCGRPQFDDLTFIVSKGL